MSPSEIWLHYLKWTQREVNTGKPDGHCSQLCQWQPENDLYKQAGIMYILYLSVSVSLTVCLPEMLCTVHQGSEMYDRQKILYRRKIFFLCCISGLWSISIENFSYLTSCYYTALWSAGLQLWLMTYLLPWNGHSFPYHWKSKTQFYSEQPPSETMMPFFHTTGIALHLSWTIILQIIVAFSSCEVATEIHIISDWHDADKNQALLSNKSSVKCVNLQYFISRTAV